jgi:hypothetical protein
MSVTTHLIKLLGDTMLPRGCGDTHGEEGQRSTAIPREPNLFSSFTFYIQSLIIATRRQCSEASGLVVVRVGVRSMVALCCGKRK